MTDGKCILLGAPVQDGAGRPGCIMGPDALRTAGIAAALTGLGFPVEDRGNVTARPADVAAAPPAVKQLDVVAGWTAALTDAARAAMRDGFPVFMGGDHALSAGTVAGVARHAQDAGRPLFVLWLDAHPDLHSPDTTRSGNLHGTPMAYVTGQPGFDGLFPPLRARVAPAHVCFMGLRSVDEAEAARLDGQGFVTHDMRAIDTHGVLRLLEPFLEQIAAANGLLHVSLDVDFLDPEIAPAVGTTVPGGATVREAHLIMERLHDSGLVTSLDLVELNPFLDERGRTARLMVDLTASLMGRRILDRPTRSH
ncbi:arginase [Rhodobacteraceae bacterium 2CG4]|uniref:Arginase n=1 Tax=Halovulum marinum TaxID=2662447 RepID=A0A6L5YX61_9RHOB|nr:arginase [Halovulum marinum]MSU88549.1 arginase [Halovulum marinum]